MLLNSTAYVSRFEVVTHDNVAAATEAVRSVCYYAFIKGRDLSFNESIMIHRQFKLSNYELLRDLSISIAAYSNQFTEHYNPNDGSVVIMGADDGCVNNGVVLATAWLDSDGSFYWED